MIPRPRQFVLSLLASGALPGCARHGAPAASSPAFVDSAAAVASFDTVWRVIRDTHYDPALKGVDWAGARDELRPRVLKARRMEEVRGVISDLVGRLGDSHYGVIPAEAIARADAPSDANAPLPGTVGLTVRLVEGRMLVTGVEGHSPASAAGVTTGWEIEHVDTFNVKALVRAVARTAGGGTPRRVAGIHAALAVSRRLAGPAGVPVTVRGRDGSDREHRLTLVRAEESAEVIRFGNLPPILSRFEAQRIHESGGCVGVIRFSTWMPVIAPAIEQAVRAQRDCGGMVLDLRGNLGGVAAMVMGVSGWFVNEELTLGVMTTRTAELRYVTIPQRATRAGESVAPFAGPLAILVDRHSASTTEMFGAGLQALGRARIFGDTTAGQALPATLLRLPDGDVLMYAVANFVSANGDRLDGRGVLPDVPVVLTRADLLAGRDPVLDAALGWLRAAVARRPE